MITHAEAKRIMDRLGWTPAESLTARAVAWLESGGAPDGGYGGGWNVPCKGSNNWGAVTAGRAWTGATCTYRDSRWDDELGQVVEYETAFRVYPTPEAGAADMARIVLKDNVREAIRRGDLRGVSRAMRDNAYYIGTVPYEQAIDRHAARMRQAVDSITAATGEPDPFEKKKQRRTVAAAGVACG
jgi:hypothetical protein